MSSLPVLTSQRFMSAIAPSGQVAASGSGALAGVSLDAWNRMGSTARIDLLIQHTSSRDDLAMALTYGMANGYEGVAQAVSLAESGLNRQLAGVAPSGASMIEWAGFHGDDVRAAPVSRQISSRNLGVAPTTPHGVLYASRGIVPSGQAAQGSWLGEQFAAPDAPAVPGATPTTPTTPAVPATQNTPATTVTGSVMGRGVRPVVFVAVTAAAIAGVYLYRRSSAKK